MAQYVARRGAPKTPKQLTTHECVLVHADSGSVVDVGAVWLVHPTRRCLSARVRSFVDLARERLRRAALSGES